MSQSPNAASAASSANSNTASVRARADRIVVVGAGPVGLTTAWLLHQAGLPVTVLEKNPTVQEDYRASTFHAPTLDLLEESGITAALERMGLKCPVFQYRGWTEGKVAEFDHGLLGGLTRHPWRLQCEQYKLSAHLDAALRAQSADSVCSSHSVIGLQQDEDGVTLQVQTPQGEHSLRADWVIAADGGRSTVRKLLQIPFEGKTYPDRILVMGTPFEFPKLFNDLSLVNYVSDPGNYAHILRIPDLWRISLPLTDATPDSVALSDDYILGRLQALMPQIGTPEIPVRGVYTAHQRVAARYRQGRVFLAGDAAHLNNPKGGMGLNGGLHDAISLARRLANVWHGRRDDSELDGYELQRRPEAMNAILRQTEENVKNLQSDASQRDELFARYRKMAADPEAALRHLMQTSMLASLKRCGMLQ